VRPGPPTRIPAMPEEPPDVARVVRVDARACEVERGDERRMARLRGRLWEDLGEDTSPVAVGDHVRLGEDEGEWTVEEVLPRRNLFARRASGQDADRRQPLAANVDRVVVVNSLAQPPFSSAAADRILATCSFAGIPALLLLNKVDAAKPRKVRAVEETYARAGVETLAVSALRGDGLEAVRERLAEGTSVLYGLSGVGKSTLLNALHPELRLPTRPPSRQLASGRHTTTHSRLYLLPGGGDVIDTPGIRRFRPYGLPPHELRLHFPELRDLGRDCRYPDCRHVDEPDCRVRDAVAAGGLARSRYRSYLELLRELEDIHGGPAREPEDGPDHKTRR